MNVIGVTQGSNLEVFLRLLDMLNQPIGIKQAGIFLSDSVTARKILKRQKVRKRTGVMLLKEWEITEIGKDTSPDWDLIRWYEKQIGDPTLWNVLIADRRLFFTNPDLTTRSSEGYWKQHSFQLTSFSGPWTLILFLLSALQLLVITFSFCSLNQGVFPISCSRPQR